ncbi:MAG: NADH-quinone oxidoreductase subunit F, partial [Actinobacteria bacterium]|nr:NADH-quinone oxidoreductase subunit F [Actinomycetota bacterium]NIT94601.1 NADH-quinone oxidoreductase subunit F [Actinomycetota bacterium]NIU18213.1 NADH-quinone oxidoreductase subunit F [Actinomycetota bacterium]NIV54710.1 NADH-quinone oxidoreductase subunit F [Actinomycetota bacterium]NIW26709.1 NADH-quinone oxidoreductase subunit F [Actinomycetota bacterium]
NIPWIIENGGAAFDAIGPEGSRGTRLFSLSGHVRKPGNYEIVMGMTWRELIYDVGGGIRDGNELKAWIPGGATAPWFVEEHLDTPVTIDDIAKNQSMAGSGAVVVMDDTTCMVKAALRIVRFFAHESCGGSAPPAGRAPPGCSRC